MGRLLAAVVAVATAMAVGGVAAADPTRKITIDTDPPGATVYLNAKEDGPACTPTPCDVTAPIGETPMIIEKDGYTPFVDSLVVPRSGKAKQKFTLEASSGTLEVEFDGGVAATVKVDGKTAGKAPGQIQLDAGNHHVIIIADGKTIYDETLLIELGQTLSIRPTMPEAPPEPPVVDKPENPIETPTQVDQTATPSRPHEPFLVIAAIFDVGFRQFTYTDPHAPMSGPFNVGNDNEAGQMMAGPLVEFYPMRAFGAGFLRRLSLVGRVEFGLNDQAVQDSEIMGTPPTTFWQAVEVSLRNRWVIADTVGVDVIAGYTQDRYEFNGPSTNVALVPDADYQSVELGGRVALVSSSIEPYLELANRIVVSGGPEQARFQQASANGLHAALGLALHTGKFMARVEGQLTRYSWTFNTDSNPAAPYLASGGTDQIELISIVLGYAL
jgi:hypothetical protein